MNSSKIPTGYYGIWIHMEDGQYWILDNEGGERAFGSHRPTWDDVETYCDDISMSPYWVGGTR